MDNKYNLNDVVEFTENGETMEGTITFIGRQKYMINTGCLVSELHNILETQIARLIVSHDEPSDPIGEEDVFDGLSMGRSDVYGGAE